PLTTTPFPYTTLFRSTQLARPTKRLGRSQYVCSGSNSTHYRAAAAMVGSPQKTAVSRCSIEYLEDRFIRHLARRWPAWKSRPVRSEEHTSELQSLAYL